MTSIQTTAADEARAIIARASDPVAVVARLRSVMGHDRTSDVMSSAERAEFEDTFATELVLLAMSLGIRVGDEVRVVRDFDQVHPHLTNIDAHYFVDAIDGMRASIRRVSRPKWMPASAPLLALVRVRADGGICDGHREFAHQLAVVARSET